MSPSRAALPHRASQAGNGVSGAQYNLTTPMHLHLALHGRTLHLIWDVASSQSGQRASCIPLHSMWAVFAY